MKVFALSGLGADERVFQFLKLDYSLTHIVWQKPQKDETIAGYAKRLIVLYEISTYDEFALVGLSFGGIMAVEIAKIIQPKKVILISSVLNRAELPLKLRLIGKAGIVPIIPAKYLIFPRQLAEYYFNTHYKAMLHDILTESDADFTKWAINCIINWKNETPIKNVVKIGGATDRLLPQNPANTALISNGGHFVIVDKPQEVSTLVNAAFK